VQLTSQVPDGRSEWLELAGVRPVRRVHRVCPRPDRAEGLFSAHIRRRVTLLEARAIDARSVLRGHER
jgi:hypothetical protein